MLVFRATLNPSFPVRQLWQCIGFAYYIHLNRNAQSKRTGAPIK
jgi:hypothetical protein